MLKTAQKWAHPAGDSHLKVLSTLVCCAQPVSANIVSALFMHRSVLVQNYLGKQMSVGTRCILAANSWTGLTCLFGRGVEHNGTIVCLQGGWEEVKWADAISISGFPIGRWQTFLQPAPWWTADFVKIIIFFFFLLPAYRICNLGELRHNLTNSENSTNPSWRAVMREGECLVLAPELLEHQAVAP